MLCVLAIILFFCASQAHEREDLQGVVVVVEHIETAGFQVACNFDLLDHIHGIESVLPAGQSDSRIHGHLMAPVLLPCALRLEGGRPIGIVHRAAEIQPAIAAPELPVLCHTITVAHPIPKESR